MRPSPNAEITALGLALPFTPSLDVHMRKLMIALATLTLSTAAFAEDPKGIRLKVSQDFFGRQAD